MDNLTLAMQAPSYSFSYFIQLGAIQIDKPRCAVAPRNVSF